MSKEKHLKQGGISKSKKCFLQSYFYTFDYLQKIFEQISKRFAKTKLVVQMWSKILSKRKPIHSLLFICLKSFIGLNSK
jgi:hypothetical protein